jgi:hypothetical protein
MAYDTPVEVHTNLTHDLPYHMENGVPVLDTDPESE